MQKYAWANQINTYDDLLISLAIRSPAAVTDL